MELLRVWAVPTAARGCAMATRAVLMLGGPFFRLPDLDGASVRYCCDGLGPDSVSLLACCSNSALV
jgi:hypothetical protein